MVLRRLDSLCDRIRALSAVPSLPESPPIEKITIDRFIVMFLCLSVYLFVFHISVFKLSIYLNNYLLARVDGYT